MVVAAWLVADGLREVRTGDRTVSRQGAGRARGEGRSRALADALRRHQQRPGRSSGKDRERTPRPSPRFSRTRGIGAEQIAVQSLEVTDLLAQAYRSGPVESRFIVAQTLMVRSPEVDRIAAASQQVGDLVARGVVLSGEGPAAGPAYVFTGLNAIKPELIAEATQQRPRRGRAVRRQLGQPSRRHSHRQPGPVPDPAARRGARTRWKAGKSTRRCASSPPSSTPWCVDARPVCHVEPDLRTDRAQPVHPALRTSASMTVQMARVAREGGPLALSFAQALGAQPLRTCDLSLLRSSETARSGCGGWPDAASRCAFLVTRLVFLGSPSP